MKFTEEELKENNDRFEARLHFYKSNGYDTIAEREYILDCASPLEGRIAEIGAGKGYMTVRAAMRGCRIIAVDLKEEYLRLARMNVEYNGVGENVEYVTGSVYELQFEDSSIDLVITVNTYHHLDDADRALTEMSRVVKPGGRIVIADFNADGFELVDRIHRLEGSGHDSGKYPPGDSGQRLSSMGFSVKTHTTRYQDIFVGTKTK